MYRSPWLNLLSITLTLSLCEDVRAEPTSIPLPLDEFMVIENAVEARISPDGQKVVSVIAKANMVDNLFEFSLYITNTGLHSSDEFHTPEILTNGPADFSPRWSPDSKRIAFLSESGGEDQIWIIPADGGDRQCWTHAESSIENFNWSADGSMIAFLAPADALGLAETQESIIYASREDTAHQIFLLDTATLEIKLLTNTDGHISGFCWSPDNRNLVFTQQASKAVNDGFEQDLYIVDVESKEVRPLIVQSGQDSMPEWSPDGQYIAFRTNHGSKTQFGQYVLRVVRPNGEQVAFPNAPDGVFEYDQCDAMDWNSDSDGLFVSTSDGLENHLDHLSLDTSKARRLTDGLGVCKGFSFTKDRRRMTFLISTSQRPKEVYVSNTDFIEPKRAHALNSFLENKLLGEVKAISWEAPDGLKIEGVLVLPVGYDADRRYPLMTYLHGGPADSFCLGFGPYGLPAEQMESFPVQVLAGLGYAVFCPNPRGSNGRGHEFRELATKNWGPAPFEDVQTGIDSLIALGVADPDRLAIGGMCYGGYLTAWAVGQTDRFKVAITEACISDLNGQFGLSDIPKSKIEYFEATPWENPDFYLKNSPLSHVESIKTPLLLHHGEDDERVPVSQSKQLFRALQYCGVPSELVIYRTEGHVIGRPVSIRHLHKSNIDWLEHWLRKAPENSSKSSVP